MAPDLPELNTVSEACPPFLSNLVVAMVIGLGASGTSILSATANNFLDLNWPQVIAAGIVAFAGAFVNGVWQRSLPPGVGAHFPIPRKDPSRPPQESG